MSSVITARLLFDIIRDPSDATLKSLPGHRIAACVFENNFNKVYLSVSSNSSTSAGEGLQTYIIKSVAVDTSPMDLSDLLSQSDELRKTREDAPNTRAEVQLDVTPSLATEINILKVISHSNIICLHEVYCEVSTTFGSHLYLVMEHAVAGPIMRLTKECQRVETSASIDESDTENMNAFFPEYECFYTGRGAMGESLASRVLVQLLSALDYLHSKNIIHRDIKVDNVLITHNGSVKLSDFGSSAQLSGESAGLVDDTAGTFLYWSPEICDEERESRPFDGVKADMWALGLTLWICLCRRPPYYSDAPLTLFEMIARQGDYINLPDFIDSSAFLSKCSAPLADVLRGLLQRDPVKRLTSEQCYQMPFVTDRGGEIVINKDLKLSFYIRFRVHMWRKRAQATVVQQKERIIVSLHKSIQPVIESNSTETHVQLQEKKGVSGRRQSLSNFIVSVIQSINPFKK